MTLRVLVIDDEPAVRFTLREVLEEAGHEVEEAAEGAAGLALWRAKGPFPVVITDLRMPGVDGMGVLRGLAGEAMPRVIVITAHGDERAAVEAMKAGAWHYLRKPFDIDELALLVERAGASAQLVEEHERLRGELNLSRSLVFASAAMRRLALLVQRLGPRDVTVLLTGESGTGKERVAEAVVRASTRADKPFVRFNCASLGAELAEAELFGHTRGAFTGAHRARPGLFREADGGTLLLDEVGELAPRVQARLLRVLADGEVRPVGEDRPRKVDVRVIAATHRDLAAMVEQGSFREDLYYRLKVVHLTIPPLRDRPEDIPLLARHFLAAAIGRFGLPELTLPGELDARLLAWRWPGNVRELAHAMEMMVALSEAGTLDLSLLPGAEQAPRAAGKGLKDRVEAYERALIVAALGRAGGNKAEAARALEISRVTLYDKLKKYGIERTGEAGRGTELA